MPDRRNGQATFREVFRVGEFQALWWSQVLSVVGDQLARVALTLLVFARTDSAVLTTLTYALTFLPDLVGGPLLSGLADRYPRRTLMVVSDVSRAALVAVMAIPGMPLVALCVLLVVVQLLNSPFTAARTAVLPLILEGDRFVAGQAAIIVTYQTGQLAGYVAGGALVQLTGTSVALLIDAGTFVASALLVRLGVAHRAAATAVQAATRIRGTMAATRQSLAAGLRLVWQDRKLRTLVWLACLSGFYVVGEGLAVPYANQLGGGALVSGLVFAALPAGTAIGMVLLTRLVNPDLRLRLMPALAVLTSAVLVVCGLTQNLVVTLVVLVACGGFSAYQTVAAAVFVRSVPDAARGQAFGLASTALRVAQGVGVVVAGALAEHWPPSLVVALFGAVGAVVAVAATMSYRRANVTVLGARPAAADT